MPAPKLFSSLPEESNSRMGARSNPAQVFAPHRSATQMLPCRSTSTPAAAPQVLPSGSLAQFSMVRYGLGRELLGVESEGACARAADTPTRNARTAAAITVRIL